MYKFSQCCQYIQCKKFSICHPAQEIHYGSMGVVTEKNTQPTNHSQEPAHTKSPSPALRISTGATH